MAASGPANTTLTMVAERAGVQRHTLYAHFPDEWSLYLACSGMTLGAIRFPDAAGWRAIADPGERLRTGLDAVYGWYQRNAALAGCVLRDAESHELTRKIIALRMGPGMQAWRDVLGQSRPARQRHAGSRAVVLHLAVAGARRRIDAARRRHRDGARDRSS